MLPNIMGDSQVRFEMRGIEDRPSPNFGPRRDGAVPDMVVLHYTGMDTAEGAIERLADPASEVSAHYLVDLDGRVVRLVAEEMRAWHAGAAWWGGVADVNSRSIGIEIVNCGHELGYLGGVAGRHSNAPRDFTTAGGRPCLRGAAAQTRPWREIRLAAPGAKGAVGLA
jgi:N-acetyl-anhydromuramyl-L-alanine amidase AmpD